MGSGITGQGLVGSLGLAPALAQRREEIEGLSRLGAAKANLAGAQELKKARGQRGLFETLGTVVGTVGGAVVGGPAGAAQGAKLGGGIGGALSGKTKQAGSSSLGDVISQGASAVSQFEELGKQTAKQEAKDVVIAERETAAETRRAAQETRNVAKESRQAAQETRAISKAESDKSQQAIENEFKRKNLLIKKAASESKKTGSKKITADQRKVATFSARMQQAEDVFDELEAQEFEPQSFLGGIAGKVLPGAGQTKERQQFEQAKRNFVNAVLRRESGAAISDQEFANADKQYFPQPKDSDEVLAQKKENRELVRKGFQVEAGSAFDELSAVLGAGSSIGRFTVTEL